MKYYDDEAPFHDDQAASFGDIESDPTPTYKIHDERVLDAT